MTGSPGHYNPCSQEMIEHWPYRVGVHRLLCILVGTPEQAEVAPLHVGVRRHFSGKSTEFET